MGLVNREGDRFHVSTPSLRGKQTFYEVLRDDAGKIRCYCLEFEENIGIDAALRCEHILAVKYSLLANNTESVTKQTKPENNDSTVVAAAETVSPIQNTTTTESRADFEKTDAEKDFQVKSKIQNLKSKIEVSARGEQKSNDIQANASENGQSEAKKAESRSLANSKGDKKVKQQINEMPFVNNEETAQTEEISNVVSGNFPNTLQQLRQNVDPHLVKSREGWRDRNGNVHMVDYVEWHTVADILDDAAPN